MNTQHPNIKLTLEFTPAGVPFLDTFVSLTSTGIRFRPYTKPTDTKTCIDFPLLTDIFENTKFLTAHRKPKNLQDHLCKADITLPDVIISPLPTSPHKILSCTKCKYREKITLDPAHVTPIFEILNLILNTQTSNLRQHNHVYTSLRCKACDIIHPITPWHEGPPALHGSPDLNCSNNNIIYALRGRESKMIYIGHTTNTLKTRLWNHRREMKKPTSLAHSHRALFANSLSAAILDHHLDTHKLQIMEAIYITYANTLQPHGLIE